MKMNTAALLNIFFLRGLIQLLSCSRDTLINALLLTSTIERKIHHQGSMARCDKIFFAGFYNRTKGIQDHSLIIIRVLLSQLHDQRFELASRASN